MINYSHVVIIKIQMNRTVTFYLIENGNVKRNSSENMTD